jgi:hypothetical protein
MLFTGKENAAYRTLERAGFVYCGGDEWYRPTPEKRVVGGRGRGEYLR